MIRLVIYLQGGDEAGVVDPVRAGEGRGRVLVQGGYPAHVRRQPLRVLGEAAPCPAGARQDVLARAQHHSISYHWVASVYLRIGA